MVSKSVAIFILSHSSGNSSKISHIPPGILRKSLTFLGEFFENPSHSSGNSSKKFCRVIEGRFIPSAVHGLFKSFNFGFIFLLERNCHIFQRTYQKCKFRLYFHIVQFLPVVFVKTDIKEVIFFSILYLRRYTMFI